MVSQNRKYYVIVIAFVVFLLYFLPFFIYGQDSHVLPWDDLDSSFSTAKWLAHSGMLFAPSNSAIDTFAGGLPRASLGRELNVMILLLYLFKPFTAYLLNRIIIHLVAFIGMYLLLKRHFIKDPEDGYLAAGVAMVFALLPFWPPGGLGVAGQPLVLYAFLNIRKGMYGLLNWVILFLVPFYSVFIFSYLFLIMVLSGLAIFDLIRSRRLNKIFCLAILFMTLVFCVVEYRLVLFALGYDSFVSHRVEILPKYLTMLQAIKTGMHYFVSGQGHSLALQFPLVIVAAMLAFVLMLKNKKKDPLLIAMLIAVIFTSQMRAFWNWNIFEGLRSHYEIFRIVQWDRFYTLTPVFWYLLFALSLVYIVKGLKWGRQIAVAVLIGQVLLCFRADPTFKDAVKGFVDDRSKAISFRQFYDEALFDEIKAYIGRPLDQYRVVSIGMHPSISQYNGFYTLDGYFSNYPLEYKHAFRKIISKELDKNPALKGYFDHWGSRFYVFSSELGYDFIIGKKDGMEIRDLDLDTQALSDLGGEYVFSAVKIANARENGLELLKQFSRDGSYYDVYLYKVVPKNGKGTT